MNLSPGRIFFGLTSFVLFSPYPLRSEYRDSSREGSIVAGEPPRASTPAERAVSAEPPSAPPPPVHVGEAEQEAGREMVLEK